jgi:hypothetical protein
MNSQEQVRQDELLDRDRYEPPQCEKAQKLAEVTGDGKLTGFVIET